MSIVPNGLSNGIFSVNYDTKTANFALKRFSLKENKWVDCGLVNSVTDQPKLFVFEKCFEESEKFQLVLTAKKIFRWYFWKFNTMIDYKLGPGPRCYHMQWYVIIVLIKEIEEDFCKP